ncbi:MAG: hypothetical protein OK455_08200 [Thaumarchaeota archaeon]|nr:hypothetical protein [Nitrososphaerota archaeon]
MAKFCVVVGATLPLGALLTRRLVAQGRAVRALVLNVERAQSILPESVSLVEIEPTNTSIQDGCEGATVIFDLFEPSSIKQQKVAAETASAVLLAGIRNRAKVIIASHLFLSEKDNRALEKEAMATHWSNFAKVVVARFPQIYGPEVKSPLLNRVFEEVLTGNKAHWMGRLDVQRSLLLIEDAVSAIEELEKNDSAFGYIWNIAGPSTLSGKAFIDLAFSAAGRKGTAGVWGRGIMLTARLIDSKAKGFLDIPYDYYSSFVIDGSPFTQAFPSFAFTPNEVAVRSNLEWYRAQMQRGLVGPTL